MNSSRPSWHRPSLGLALLGILTLWGWWQIHALGDLRERLGSFYGYFALTFAAYLGALWLVRRIEATHAWRDAGPGLLAALLVACLSRAMLLGTTPTFSDDIYRYRWDGRVQLSGLDPYAYPPNHPALAFLRDADFSRINFPSLRTVYPPLTERAFALGAWLGPTLTMQKIVFVAAELVTVLSLLLLLAHRGRSLLWVLAYAWHPLVILEIAGQGHNDALGVALLWLGIAAWEGHRRLGAALAWSGALLSKFLSVILVPWWWMRRDTRRGLLLFLALSAGPFLLHPTAATAVLESLSAMTGRMAPNGSLYPLLAGLLGRPMLAPLAALGLGGGFLLWWARREADPVRYVMGGIAAAALLAPTLHPWYLIWLIPGFSLWRVPAPLALTGTAVLSYTIWTGFLADGSWAMPMWARLLEYGPVVLLLIWEVARCGWRSSHHLAVPPVAGCMPTESNP